MKETHLSHALSSAGVMAQYDMHVKNLFKDKGVLAYILKYAVAEFRDYSLEEAAAAIEGEPEIASRSLRPDTRNNRGQAIRGESTESKLDGEGTVLFDVVFTVLVRTERAKIYVNIEAQKSYYPGYDLVPRGVFYAARLLSEQLDVEFTTDNYDGIKKVYSIFICMTAPVQNRNHEAVSDTIVSYRMQPEVIYANDPARKVAFGRYDLLGVVFVHLQAEGQLTKNKLIGMLSTLLERSKEVEKKKTLLEQEYGLQMNESLEKEVNTMCNLSELILEEGLEKGREDTKEKGLEEGLEKGREDTTCKMLKNLIKNMKVSLSQALDILEIPESERNKYQKLL
ncbi:MAG: hypothetical protein Q4C65_04830 [Eubacteriales bacterium]|nr:hypothetical protein [Eubacteriales bacterium]